MTDSSHIFYMQEALALAREGLGMTGSNPTVGCVLVQDGVIVGRGNTAKGGRPHAEAIALEMAAGRAKGAVAYVTLEPCSHHGQTPPCAKSLIDAAIACVVVACQDPYPEVNGHGIAMLKRAGVDVVEGVCMEEAQRINRGFFRRVTEQLPEITVKIATTQDGSFTLPNQKWITGESSRRYVHRMRSEHNAILTGIGTVLADDPELTCRLPDRPDRSPSAFVADSHLRIPESARLVRNGTVIFTLPESLSLTEKIARLHARGVEVIAVEAEGARVSAHAMAKAVASRGHNRLMVEAGPALGGAFLSSTLVDSLYWFKGPQFAYSKEAVSIEVASHTHKTHLTLEQDSLDILSLR